MITCKHEKTHEVIKYAIEDPPSHYLCLDCGDSFPLIGDTDEWKPKLAYTVADMADILNMAVDLGHITSEGHAAISGLMIGRAMASFGRKP
jgi:hypothetical protein